MCWYRLGGGKLYLIEFKIVCFPYGSSLLFSLFKLMSSPSGREIKVPIDLLRGNRCLACRKLQSDWLVSRFSSEH